MIRLLGAITGSALALATLLVLVGIPQFKAAPSDVERDIVTLPLKTETVDDAVLANEPAVSQHAVNVAGEEHLALEESVLEEIGSIAVQEAVNEPSEDFVSVAEQEAVNNSAESIEQPAEIQPDKSIAQVEQSPKIRPSEMQHWYAFWSPFRSKIAASGFVAQLQRVTGLDYRVVKVKPGKYEVAFGYVDDADIPLNLSQISAATGLDLPES